MSERASMKRRARNLIHTGGFAPIGALFIALLPVFLLSVLLIVLMRPTGAGNLPLTSPISFTPDDPKGMLLQILTIFIDPLTLISPLIGWLPLLLCLLALHLFIGMPLCIAVCGYYLALLGDKRPKITAVFASFSGRYPRVLGASAYLLLWQLLWFVVSFVAPLSLLCFSVVLVSALGISLNAQLYLFAAILVLSILWLIICLFVFINRMLAYCLTPACIAAQPRLAARRGIRLSRKLMRGHKGSFLALMLSFLLYFLPALIAGLGLLVLPLFGLGAGTLGTLRTVLWCVVLVNQLAWLYVLPYMTASYNVFYIERKRTALLDDEISSDDLATQPRIPVVHPSTTAKKDA